jgi:sulfide:quinone oxidoreductase
MPKPIPISDEVSTAIVEILDERGIHHSHATWTERLDPGTRIAHLRDGRALPFDLFLAVPGTSRPPVVVESGLTEDDGWVAVDKATLATKWPDVYAVGDVASTPVPRAGVIAEGEASTVADVLIHTLRGGPAPAPFAGEITCYVEMGGETIGRVNVNFLSGPAPVAVYSPPSLEGTEEKAVRRHAPRPLVRHRARLTRHHSGSALTASCSACVICRQG